MTRQITTTITGPIVLSLSDPLASGGSDDPLFISSSGTIEQSGTYYGDGIDGAAGTVWTIINDGTVLGNYGISLAGAGLIYNSGEVWGGVAGVQISCAGLVVNEGWIDSPASGVEIDGNGVVANQGTITGAGGGDFGVLIDGDGAVTNEGEIISEGYNIQIDGIGSVINYGSIVGADGNAITLEDGGSITNYGTIKAGTVAIIGTGGSTSLTNFGIIAGAQGVPGSGVLLDGPVTNFGTISGAVIGVSAASIVNFGTITANPGFGGEYGSAVDASTVENKGLIEGTSVPGVEGELVTNFGTIIGNVGIQIGDGTVTNQGSILGGVEVTNGSGTVINQGVMSSGIADPGMSVLFDLGTANNLLVIKPTAVFNGAAEASGATNSTVELSTGSGAISGIGEGQFDGFDTLKADPGASWTLNGPNTIGTVLNDGTLGVSGSLDVSTAVDPGSAGLFQLIGTSTLEVAAALGISSKMSFATGSELLIDNFASFGKNVGTSSYAGSLLENFGGSTIDLAGFAVGGLDMNFSTSTGLLQLTNSESQAATLDFQKSTLGAGTFHFASDGASGVLITHT